MKKKSILLFLAFLNSYFIFGQTNKVGIRQSIPLYTLHVTHANGTPAAAAGNGIAIAHDLGPLWGMYVSNTGGELRFYNGGILEISFTPDGTINTLSDERAKKNISLLQNGQLKKILALQPKNYQYINSKTNKWCTGFLAQELYKIFPDAVNYIPKDDDGKETWMVSYQTLIPHIIKGMQEQQEIILAQQNEIDNLKKQQENVLSRIAKLEKNYVNKAAVLIF